MKEERTVSCPVCRKKEREAAEVKRLKNRLVRIAGQIGGISRMVEESAYCPDILIQVSAVQSALASFSRELLGEHIRTCVADDIKSGKEGSADELAALMARLMR